MACTTLGVNWPAMLPSCETEEKSREEIVGFVYSDLNSGPAFMQMISDDLPTFWDVSFKFTRKQARIFQMWLTENKHRTRPTWFNFPIQIESGLIADQEVRFVSYPQATGQRGDLFTYSGRIMARAVDNIDEKCPSGSLYILLYTSCNNSDLTSANCFGKGFDDGWPKA